MADVANRPDWTRIRDLMWERGQLEPTKARLVIWRFALGKLGESEPVRDLIFDTRVRCAEAGMTQAETTRTVRAVVEDYWLPQNEITRRVDRAVRWRVPDTVGECLGGGRW